MKKLGPYLKQLRQNLGLSQAAIGQAGFVSEAGWIKLENGQRSPSEELIEKFTDWLVRERHRNRARADVIKAELLCLKHMDDPSPFVAYMAEVTAFHCQLHDIQPEQPKPFVFTKKRKK